MQTTQHEFSILGQKIVIKNDAEAKLATMAVEVVNEKLAEIQEKNPLMGPQQIAVLALLEVAGNLIRDRKTIDEYRKELDQRCSLLMTELSQLTQQSSVAM